jgi:pimeloyl-ACP methyl ester carboxylesterase
MQDWIVFAHGYVPMGAPAGTAWLQLKLPDGSTIPQLVNGLGYGFAASEYSKNGLAIKEGIQDTIALAQYLRDTLKARNVYLVGASEGGLITTLIMEGSSQFMTGLANPFNGAVSACGPNGDFRLQINYFGDFRVLFDYFFPGVIPGSPISIPQSLIDDWPRYYTATIQPIVFVSTNTARLEQLLRVSNAPYVSGLVTTVDTSVYDALSYNVLATNDAIEKLGGQPFDNYDRVYTGSDNDTMLNQQVQRFTAEMTALHDIDLHYQTTGQLSVPLVTLHTTLDQQVPYWHQALYRVKVIQRDSLAFHQPIEVNRYGHCYFEAPEAVGSFLQLVSMVLNPPTPYASPRLYLPVISRGP